MPLTIIEGLLATEVFHLNLAWSIVAIVTGNALGAIIMALHSAQGPRLGVPQLIQTRAQFGQIGSLLIVIIAIVMYLGFLASILVLAGESINQLASGLSINVGIVISAALTLIVLLFGYNVIHGFNRYLLPLFGLSVVLALIWMLGVHGLPSDFTSKGSVSTVGFLGTVSSVAIWQISYAPYVSDYSRYLPENTRPRNTFWWTYVGTVLSAIPMMVVGAVIGILTSGANTLADLNGLTGSVSVFVLIMFWLGAVDACVINLYSPMLCLVTAVQTFRSRWLPGARARWIASSLFAAVATYVAVAFRTNFLVHYTDFITLLLFVLIPWSVVNLVDYYLIRKGEYDVRSFFTSGGGIYGNLNTAVLLVYLIGILVEVPFMVTSFYTGFLVSDVGGANITWLVGIVVTTPLSYFGIRWYKSRGRQLAPVT